jgi:hypothetical protein
MGFKLFEEFSDDELLLLDITFIGFTQKAWDYSRGARTERNYMCIEEPTQLKIKDHYDYTMTNGNRDIATVARQITWYKDDNTVGLTKDISKEFTPKSLGELNQTVRKGRMTDLRENAKAVTGGQGLIDSIYSWYGTEISEYENIGSLAFENALINETDPIRLGTLNFAITEFGGATIMQLLAFQLIGAYSWT